ncbi:MAG TPA: hypothetical protein VKA84_03195 [Gemmatimonadaceae bacterium]|nr:hypothetical protein [Gemmatimonadaceae bacterium]
MRAPAASFALLLASAGTVLNAQRPADRFAPHSKCAPTYSLGAAVDSAALRAGVGTLVVRMRTFDGQAAVGQLKADVAPVDSVNPASVGTAFSRDTSSVRVFRNRPAGRYSFVARGIPYWPAYDTLDVRAGRTDTVDVSLESWEYGSRNWNNCRPHRFRAPGEPACVTDHYIAEQMLANARGMAYPPWDSVLGRPRFKSSDVSLVRDERTCERAAAAYGGDPPGDPARRVVVVRMGRDMFLVMDPFEPHAAGEWNVAIVYDREFRPIHHLLQ